MKRNIANIITGVRIILSAALLFFPAWSIPFYALYIAAGVSDMIDGAIARKTGGVSDFGAKLDTAADLVFAAACLIKLIPVIDMPKWLYFWIALIALIKLINIICGFICRKEFAALHTLMNRVTGALLFILPLTIPFVEIKYTAPIVCAVATFAAVQEGHFIRTKKDL